MKWSEMTSRERDALVAEKVMGINPPTEAMRKRGVIFVPKHYTTDIACAWEVVEKMQEHGTDTVVIAAHGDGEWECEFEGSLALSSAGARCPTAPEAICLAALRAKGVEV